MGKKNDIQPGQNYGDWAVVSCLGAPQPGKHVLWLCACSCGQTAAVNSYTLRAGTSKRCRACGIEKANLGGRSLTHGATRDYSRTGAYQTWVGMHSRCYDENQPNYANYGGRGIAVCPEWFEYERFLSDMGERPAGRSIDRIDNLGSYQKDNCRWATRKEQSSNTRANVYVTHQGVSVTVTEACRISGASRATLDWYRKRGEDVQSAFDHALHTHLLRVKSPM